MRLLARTDPVEAAGRDLPRLTATRGVAATLVVLFHLGHWHVLTPNPVPWGYAAVAYFFVLSGFVLTWSLVPGTPVTTYYRRRAARIWPNHLVMMAVALLLPPVREHAVTAAAVVAHALLLQAWWPKGAVVFGLNGVSWSLSVEVAFYAALPLLLPWLRRLSSPTRWRVAIAAFVLDGVGVLATAAVGGVAATGGFTFPPMRASEFVLGCVLALEVREGLRFQGFSAVLAAAWAVVVVTVLPHPLPSLDVLLTPSAVVLIGWAAGSDLAGRPGWGRSRPLVRLGEWSFALYLVHQAVIRCLQQWVHVSTWVLAPLMVVGSLLAAAALHHLVERPAQRRLAGRRPSPHREPTVPASARDVDREPAAADRGAGAVRREEKHAQRV